MGSNYTKIAPLDIRGCIYVRQGPGESTPVPKAAFFCTDSVLALFVGSTRLAHFSHVHTLHQYMLPRTNLQSVSPWRIIWIQRSPEGSNIYI